MIDSGLIHFGDFFIGIEFAGLTFMVLVASIYDIKLRRIPNWLVAIGLTSSLLYQAFSGYGYGFMFWSTGLGIGALCFFPLYIIRAMGAGGVKLMAAVSSFVGGTAALQIIVLTLLAGGVLALLIVLKNRSLKLAFQNIGLMTANLTIAALTRQLPKGESLGNSAGSLPYGVAIAAGTLIYITFFRP